MDEGCFARPPTILGAALKGTFGHGFLYATSCPSRFVLKQSIGERGSDKGRESLLVHEEVIIANAQSTLTAA